MQPATMGRSRTWAKCVYSPTGQSRPTVDRLATTRRLHFRQSISAYLRHVSPVMILAAPVDVRSPMAADMTKYDGGVW